MAGGLKVLNPTPADVRYRTEFLSDIRYDPTYYVGFSPILEVNSNVTFIVASGDHVAGWVFREIYSSTSDGDKTFIYDQNTSSDVWVVEHNMGKSPSVTVHDSAGSEIVGRITYDSPTKITIRFSAAFKGAVYLN